MGLQRTSTVEEVPADPVGDAVAEAVGDVMAATVELAYSPAGTPPPAIENGAATASAVGPGPPGWDLTYVVRLDERVERLVAASGATSIPELLAALPDAGLAAAEALRHHHADEVVGPLGAALRRALRDTVAAEILARYLGNRVGENISAALVAESIEFLIELSSTRVESHDLTHGVVITDVLHDTPRLSFAYPRDIRAAKRAPLLFDGQRSVLVVDSQGRARTELQRHRIERVPGRSVTGARHDDSVESGSLVAEATRQLGGLGLFLRADRSLWTFVDGLPLLVRRGEHWTSFPVELTTSISNMTGGAPAADLVARAAFMISAQPGGAILAIVDSADDLAEVVSPKDRYDLRNDIDPAAMRPETRLHHLIDAEDLDEHTLVRLAMLDGATVLDRDGRLLAYGAIVTSADSEHEGARTAAAKTLSNSAQVVLKVSVDSDITIFRHGRAVTTLLGRSTERIRRPRR